jgi:hypothetical protein
MMRHGPQPAKLHAHAICPLLLVAALAGSTSACALAAGTPYPGAARRVTHDHGGYVERTTPTHRIRTWRPGTGERIEKGGGSHGFSIGASIGTSALSVGERSHAFQPVLYGHLEYTYAFDASFGLALASGGIFGVPANTDDGGEFAAIAIPLDVKLLWRPANPLVLHAGVAGDYHMLRFAVGADETKTDGFGFHLFDGLGLAIPTGGYTFVLEGQVRQRWYGAVELAGVDHDVDITEWLARIMMVF